MTDHEPRSETDRSARIRHAMVELGMGVSLCLAFDADFWQQELNARCPDAEHEVNAVILAIKFEIVSEMRRLHRCLPSDYLLPKLSRWLARQAKLDYKQAESAVESWAVTMGIRSVRNPR